MPENNGTSLNNAILALSKKQAQQAKEEELLEKKKPAPTGMDIMNSKPAVTNPDLKEVSTKPDTSIKNMVSPATEAASSVNNEAIARNVATGVVNSNDISPVSETKPVVYPTEKQKIYTKAEEIEDIKENNNVIPEINHEELAKIAEDKLKENKLKKPKVVSSNSGRPASEKTKALRNASRVSEDFAISFSDAIKTSTIKDFPKAMVHFIELELKSAGLYDIKQTDMVVGWIASKLDAESLKKMAIALTDTQLHIVKTLHHNAFDSDAERLTRIEKQIQNLDKKVDTVRLMEAYTLMDRAGWIKENMMSPERIEFDYTGPIGGIVDVINRADNSVLKLRMDLNKKTGRPKE